MSIGKNIQKQRKKCGWTQKQVAEKLFISEKVMSHYETNKRDVSIELLERMADLFNVSLTELTTNRPYDHIKHHFLFLTKHPNFTRTTFEGKKSITYEFRDDSTKENDFLYINVNKALEVPGGISFCTRDGSDNHLFKDENEVACILDAPSWFIDLYIKSMDLYERCYRKKHGGFQEPIITSINRYFLIHYPSRKAYLQTMITYQWKKIIRVDNDNHFEQLVKYIEEKGTKLLMCHPIGYRYAYKPMTNKDIIQKINQHQAYASRMMQNHFLK